MRANTKDKIEALALRFRAGEFSETVYRASLYANGLRGDDIDHIVRRQMEIVMDFGFTNDSAKLKAAEDYRDAAAADGWKIRPTYGSSESAGRASSLDREGFKMMALTRDNSGNGGKWKYEVQISLWGPDGLAIAPPEIYDFAEIRARTRRCGYCKDEDVDTERVGFAGRCCGKCLPAMRTKIETPGWTR